MYIYINVYNIYTYFCIPYIFINVYIYCSYTRAYKCISTCSHVGTRKLIAATVCFKAFQCMAACSWSDIPSLALSTCIFPLLWCHANEDVWPCPSYSEHGQSVQRSTLHPDT